MILALTWSIILAKGLSRVNFSFPFSVTCFSRREYKFFFISMNKRTQPNDIFRKRAWDSDLYSSYNFAPHFSRIILWLKKWNANYCLYLNIYVIIYERLDCCFWRIGYKLRRESQSHYQKQRGKITIKVRFLHTLLWHFSCTKSLQSNLDFS